MNWITYWEGSHPWWLPRPLNNTSTMLIHDTHGKWHLPLMPLLKEKYNVGVEYDAVKPFTQVWSNVFTEKELTRG